MLLGPDDPSPVSVLCPDGPSPLLLTGDHAGRELPRALGRLGLPEPELERHIAWDLGIGGVIAQLSEQLQACAIVQRYSRLVIDCNRPPSAESSIPAISDRTPIPGNQRLEETERRARRQEIFEPYHTAIAQTLDRGRHPIYLAMHSFTPVFQGYQRPWHAAVLYHRDARLAQALKAGLEADGLVVGDNEPYRVSDESDYGIPVHAERRGLLHVLLEIRQDLIASAEQQHSWALRLGRLLRSLEMQ